MKFISWNVNGFRAVLQKGFEESFNALDADFFCLQETKMQPTSSSHPDITWIRPTFSAVIPPSTRLPQKS